MKPVDARQRFGAAAIAISVTFSLIWGLSSYAYGGAPAAVLLVAGVGCGMQAAGGR
jgi:hypothetical protein